MDEIGGNMTSLDDKKIKQLEHHTGTELKTRVENIIKHVQNKYDVDILGFGAILREEKPEMWNQIGRRWETENFKDVTADVNTNLHIKGSGMLSKPIQEGD